MFLIDWYQNQKLGTKVVFIASSAITICFMIAALLGINAYVAAERSAGVREKEAMEKSLKDKAELVSGLLARISVMSVMSQDLSDLQIKAHEAMRDSDFVEVLFSGKDGSPLAREARDTTAISIELNRKIVTDKETMGIEKEVGGLHITVSRARVEAMQSELEKRVATQQRNAWIVAMLLCGVINVLLVALLYLVIRNRVSQPLGKALSMVEAVAEGRLDQDLHSTSNDEIGRLFGALHRMKEYLGATADIADSVASGDLRKIHKPISDKDRLGVAIGTMTKALRESLETVRELAVELSKSSRDLKGTGDRLLSEASGVSIKAGDASGSSETVASNVRTVAAAAEEMSASIQEIARSAEGSRRTAGEALAITKSAVQRVEELSAASLEISRVTEVIVEIAEQTKLLALNATIEAARAGEAGRGFAVVAGEVKELAKSTSEATEDIRKRIETIQATTHSTVEDIGQVRDVMGRIEGAVSNIAAAVEEQSVTTNEIVRNVTDSSRLVGGITKSITEVATSSIQAEHGARDVLGAVEKVANAAECLEALSARFKL
ncbi:MAG: HAMP domain-containing methyl-accepting chemotaxis protein [Fibrobacterota bacterium]